MLPMLPTAEEEEGEAVVVGNRGSRQLRSRRISTSGQIRHPSHHYHHILNRVESMALLQVLFACVRVAELLNIIGVIWCSHFRMYL